MTHWLFQANPAKFDLVAAARAGGPGVYAMNQHRSEANAGDFVFFCLSGSEAGIYATGHLTGPPYRATERDEYGEWKVPIEYHGLLDYPVMRQDLLDDHAIGAWRPWQGLQRTNGRTSFAMYASTASR